MVKLKRPITLIKIIYDRYFSQIYNPSVCCSPLKTFYRRKHKICIKKNQGYFHPWSACVTCSCKVWQYWIQQTDVCKTSFHLFSNIFVVLLNLYQWGAVHFKYSPSSFGRITRWSHGTLNIQQLCSASGLHQSARWQAVLSLVSESSTSFWNRWLISAGPKDTIISATLGPCCRSEENSGSVEEEWNNTIRPYSKKSNQNLLHLSIFSLSICKVPVVNESL